MFLPEAPLWKRQLPKSRKSEIKRTNYRTCIQDNSRYHVIVPEFPQVYVSRAILIKGCTSGAFDSLPVVRSERSTLLCYTSGGSAHSLPLSPSCLLRASWHLLFGSVRRIRALRPDIMTDLALKTFLREKRRTPERLVISDVLQERRNCEF